MIYFTDYLTLSINPIEKKNNFDQNIKYQYYGDFYKPWKAQFIPVFLFLFCFTAYQPQGVI